ncbi:diacylglycerol kinase [Endozoicomonas numazuensis]|uniref:Diacylglycerol kinase n=1 Tax=Endozoicomonas numazuensis TaxID=1137799 RepID=A0A081NDQ2_9GAMM|nr:diacylglycerol kinase [Endozoicomonas numazuensis]KEQ16575.1 diacylglycerol kinase [Endozoicomonas numazuensis]
MKPGKTGFTRILYASMYSIKGFRAAWKNEAAFRQEIILLIIGFGIASYLPLNRFEMLALIGSLIIIIITELLNSAIEAVVDRTGSDWNELSGRAKDMGSAAVMSALILAALTWLTVLYRFL